jgi:hypothetical protein
MCCVYLFDAGQVERASKLLADTGTTEKFQPLLDGLAGDWEGFCSFLEKEAAAKDPNGSRMERWQNLVALAARRRLMGQHDAAQAALLLCLGFTDPADQVCQMSVRYNLALLYAGEMGRTAEAKIHLARCREIMAAGEDWRGIAGDVMRARRRSQPRSSACAMPTLGLARRSRSSAAIPVRGGVRHILLLGLRTAGGR